MLVLDVSLDVGGDATPAQVEALVRAVRVSTDIGRITEEQRVRRNATEQMKFPTNDELRAAIERFPPADESGPRYRAARHLEAREQLAAEAGRLPPDIWWDYWYRRRGSTSERFSLLSSIGYERAFEGASLPWAVGVALGLDVLDPILYEALVADHVARLTPQEIVVRELRYSNPFGEVVAGAGAAEKAVKTTAGVIETAATLGSRRKLKKVEARVAEATVDDKIEGSRLENELRREQLRRAKLENDIAAEELRTKQIENAQALDAFDLQRQQRALIRHFVSSGKLDQADAIAALAPADAAALMEFALRPPRLEERYEVDPDVDLE